MYFQKISKTILLMLLIHLSACSTKKASLPLKIEEASAYPKLISMREKLVQKCQAKNFKDENGSIYIKLKDNFLAIDLNEKSEFRNKFYNLTKNSKEKLTCIIPILKEYNKLFIVITGHANKHKKRQANQHLSDNRAISVAEFLFNKGIRDEIFAKGCANTPLNDPEKKLDIFIHVDKSNIINHCLNH